MLQETGLAETIGKSGADTFGVDSQITITIFAVILAIIISETTSNTASASVVVPIVIPVAMAAGVDPFVPALAATFAASFGFMLPCPPPRTPSSTGRAWCRSPRWCATGSPSTSSARS
jgi:sodium-dependent dicarboxylate transporter 2/3/5